VPLIPRPAAGPRRFRKSVESLSTAQLAALRNAFAAVMRISDDRGFNHYAGIHGLPLPMYCQHGTDLFLPWHRAYLYFFELALQDRTPGAVLPWWDWSSPASRTKGIPNAYALPTPRGRANPLYKATVPPVARQNGQPRVTTRRPQTPSGLPTPGQVERVLALDDFLDFSAQLEDLHGQIHVWAGGTMGMIAWAAYDPIFWAHHGMIDRLWRMWQLRHPQGGPDPTLRRQALPPFKMTVAETLDVAALGYDYAAATAHAPGTS
jgi:tyrosinase